MLAQQVCNSAVPVHREVVSGLIPDSTAYNFTPLSSVSMRSQVTELPLVVASYFTCLLAPTRSLAALHCVSWTHCGVLPSPGLQPARRVSAKPRPSGNRAVLVPAPGSGNAHHTSALARGRWTHTVDTGAEASLACITKTGD